MSAKAVVAMNPLGGHTGFAIANPATGEQTRVYLQLQPGESVILRAFSDYEVDGPAWSDWRPVGTASEISGNWKVEFLAGGPTLPASLSVSRLQSWTTGDGGAAQNFAGTGRYSISFDAPKGGSPEWLLSLGKVCQSARVRLNGRDLGTLITPPFRLIVKGLKAKGNKLEVEVTNVSANAIRYYDREGVKWKNFHDINFVNLDYRPFDASGWPLADSGLLGPVTLTPIQDFKPLEAMP